jgi:hypothetical protein
MSGIILGTFNLVGNCIGFVVNTSLSIVVLVGISASALYATKPDEKSFEKFIENEAKKKAPGPISGKILGKVINNSSGTAFTDMVVARRADLKFVDGSEKHYIGVLGTWFEAGSNSSTTSRTYVSNGVTTHHVVVNH